MSQNQNRIATTGTAGTGAGTPLRSQWSTADDIALEEAVACARVRFAVRWCQVVVVFVRRRKMFGLLLVLGSTMGLPTASYNQKGVYNRRKRGACLLKVQYQYGVNLEATEKRTLLV